MCSPLCIADKEPAIGSSADASDASSTGWQAVEETACVEVPHLNTAISSPRH